MVSGLRIDYLSPTLYLTDILILGILVSWGTESLLKFKMQSAKFKVEIKNSKLFWGLLFIGCFLIINSFFVPNQPVAFYKFLKILEFFLLGLYIVKNSSLFPIAYSLLPIPIIYSSFLAIAQFLNQGSLGGVFWFLGERTFNASTPGIAQAIFNGQLILRPYATFPHPNVLAGFLVVGLLILISNSRNLWRLIPGIFYQLSIVLGMIALFLTFSRVAWLVFLLAVTSMFLVKRREKRKYVTLFLLVISLASLISLTWLPIQSESFSYRQDLNLVTIKMFQSSPLLGVGLNNFLVRLPEFYKFPGPVYFLQPAHNIYLLTMAETGLLGLVGLICFLFITIHHLIQNNKYLLLVSVFAVLALGLFDHYFYTLQQGQLLITMVFGLAWSKTRENVKIHI